MTEGAFVDRSADARDPRPSAGDADPRVTPKKDHSVRNLALVSCLSLMVLASCIEQRPGERSARPSPAPEWVGATLQSMSLQEKVAQMFVIWTPGRYVAQDTRQWQELERLASERKVGGFVFSSGDVYEYAMQINRMQRMATVPLLISADFEHGTAMRVRNTTSFPSAMALGAAGDPDLTYAIAKATALEGRALGVHQNYAPTLDINTNPRNPVINIRSFGDDPELVSAMGAAYIRGTQDAGMIATAKHFPGHGDMEIDSHLGISVIPFPMSRLDTFELRPFRAAIAAGTRSVMIGHPGVGALDSGSILPSTVSANVTTKLLKERLAFSGLVVSDAFEMRGLTATYEPGEAAVLAVKAGIDLILMPANPDVAIDAVIAAVRRGEIPLAHIEASVKKILEAKKQLGLDAQRSVDPDRIPEIVGCRAHRMLALEAARAAVTVLGNAAGLLPLRTGDSRRVMDLVVSETDEPSAGRDFHDLLRTRHPRMEYARFDGGSNRCEIDSIVARAQRADLLIVQLHYYMRSGEMTGFVRYDQRELLLRLAELRKPLIGIAFGNPYVAMNLPRFDTYLCTYGNSEPMQTAAAEVLFGEAATHGRLPIRIPDLYRFGEGVDLPKVALRTGEPAEAGFDPAGFRKVDEAMNTAVRDSAFPGGVLLVARNGIVVLSKAYGAMDYGLYAKRVDVNTVYDLASVTKVIATTSAVMRLVDERRISLSDPVVKYFPAFGQAGKSRITVYNLLVHNSGLPAWRKFYEFCDAPDCVMDSIFATHLVYPTGDSMVYSDLGLITTGKIVERVTGRSLDRYVDSVFFRPLGMTNTMYNPPASLLPRIAPTEVDTYWKKTGVAVHGRVHDENAAVLGGVSGHAGLFSTASDLAVILQMLLNGGSYGGTRYLTEATIRQFTTRQSERSSRGIGWDLKGSDRSFSGRFTSPETFLHTGFTGTSVVVDPKQNLIVVLLTNRVFPTRNNGKISEARPRVHNAVIEALRPK